MPAFPSVAGRQNSATTTAGTSHTINFDAAPSAGDLLVVFAVFDGVPAITWPADWIQVASMDSGTAIRSEVRYKVAAGEGASISLSTGVSAEMQARAWRIAAGSFHGTPRVESSRAAGTSASPNPPVLSPFWGSADYLWLALNGADGSSVTTAWPAGYSQTGAANSGGATGVGIGYCERSSTGSSQDPGTFTITNDEWTAWTVAIQGATTLSPGTIVLSASLQSTVIRQRVLPTAHALAAVFSAASANQRQQPTGLALVVSYPDAAILSDQLISPSALGLTAVFPTVNVNNRLFLSTFGLTAVFPTATVVQVLSAAPIGIAAVFDPVTLHRTVAPAPAALVAILTTPVVSAVAPPEPPAPEPSVGTDVVVRIYDGESGASLGEWANVTVLSITFGVHGPETATVGLPREVDGALNPALHYRRLMPGFRGVFVEVDARALGVEEVWLGRATNAPVGSTQAEVQVSCQGPNRILERESVPVESEFMAAAGPAIRQLLIRHPTPLRVMPDAFEEGPAIVVSLGGASLWEAITSIEDMSLGRLYFTGIPGEATWRASYRSQIVPAPDERSRLVLDDGFNAEWDIDNDLDPGTDQLVLVGQSFTDGQDNNAVRAFAPGGLVLGRQAALTATVQSAVATAVSGQGETAVRPDLAALPALVSQVDAELRAGLYPPVVASVRVLDQGLWPRLRVGMIVETRFRKDPLGLFTRALAEVQQITWGLKPQRTCDLGIELWALAE